MTTLMVRSLLMAAFAGSLITATGAHAQPTVRDHRPDPRPKAPPRGGPREAPPPPRADPRPAARPGFAWIVGRWDWRGGKWQWLAGHWERERAGKKWRDGRWDKKGEEWVYVDGEWTTDGGATTPDPTRPREAPPPPRVEKQAARAGFIWVSGRWDWRAGKWEWLAGHSERERAGKKWREGRWDRKGDDWVYADGEWIEAGGSPPIVPPDRGPPDRGPPDRRPPRVWKLDRPVVSSYWPAKGKPGTRVVIRGRNFPTDASVMWGPQIVRAAKVTPNQIVFAVPAQATTSRIMLKVTGRDVGVGSFEVGATFDAAAEARKLDEERRRAAEAAWAARQKELARDRAAREAEIRRRSDEREASREERRRERAAAIRAKWDRAFLADPNTQDELTLHAQRIAELGRMREIAELSSNGKLAVRIDIAQSRETDRHDQRMAALKTDFQGGTP